MTQRQMSDEDLVRELARLSGIPIPEEEVAEVANRFESLMLELDRLSDLDPFRHSARLCIPGRGLIPFRYRLHRG